MCVCVFVCLCLLLCAYCVAFLNTTHIPIGELKFETKREIKFDRVQHQSVYLVSKCLLHGRLFTLCIWQRRTDHLKQSSFRSSSFTFKVDPQHSGAVYCILYIIFACYNQGQLFFNSPHHNLSLFFFVLFCFLLEYSLIDIMQRIILFFCFGFK